MFLPAAGCIAPGTARNRVGLLPAQQPSAAGSVRARGGYLQRRGAPCPCSFSTILAGAQAKTGPFLGLIARDRLQLPSELGLGCRNPARQAVSPSLAYL